MAKQAPKRKKPASKPKPKPKPKSKATPKAIKSLLDVNSVADFEATLNSAFDRISINIGRSVSTAQYEGMTAAESVIAMAPLTQALDALKQSTAALVAAMRRGVR